MNLDNEILELTCKLYANLSFSRNDIQIIINLFQNFIKNSYNPCLLKALNDNLYKAVDDDVVKEINKTFEKYKDPFKNYSTEDKRLRLYKNRGLYTEPVLPVIKYESVPKTHGKKLRIQGVPISILCTSLKDSLRKLLKIEGLFDATVSYMDFLKKEKNVMMNVIQGELWQNQFKKCNKDGIILPLIGYFDDIETGDALGSHSGKK